MYVDSDAKVAGTPCDCQVSSDIWIFGRDVYVQSRSTLYCVYYIIQFFVCLFD